MRIRSKKTSVKTLEGSDTLLLIMKFANKSLKIRTRNLDASIAAVLI